MKTSFHQKKKYSLNIDNNNILSSEERVFVENQQQYHSFTKRKSIHEKSTITTSFNKKKKYSLNIDNSNIFLLEKKNLLNITLTITTFFHQKKKYSLNINNSNILSSKERVFMKNQQQQYHSIRKKRYSLKLNNNHIFQ